MKFKEVIKQMVKYSGGSVDKIKWEEYMDMLNDSFIRTPWNYWLGTRIEKNPLDLMILQEIMFEKRPDTIIECGTAYGGSAYYMACLMDLMKIDGKVISIDCAEYTPQALPKKDLIKMDGKMIAIDLDSYQMPVHPKIEFIHSDCLTADIPKCGIRTMVILDCDHTASHVYAELEKYSSIVTAGQYIIVEDTVLPDKSNGPSGAVEKFLSENKNFVVDKSREKYGVSSNRGGYLLKIV